MSPQGRRRRRAIGPFYPEIRVCHDLLCKHGQPFCPLVMSRGRASYSTTITRPDLFRNYLTQQIAQIIQNHGVKVEIGPSSTPMPVHFAVGE